ncbi:hypothetical protein K439DRAFT_1639935 [Ramaria rubella]|nr:hypothetical protein K439DRAFT_1639935 [Ramaria rubella]
MEDHIPLHFNSRDTHPRIIIETCFAVRNDVLSKNCRVVEVKQYKEDGGPNHEYLIAQVVITCGTSVPVTRFIKIERTVNPRAFSESKSSITSGSPAPAVDTVTYSQLPSPQRLQTPGSRLRLTLTFQNLSLGDFYGLLLGIHIISPDYQLFTRQCWWFCWLIIQSSHELWSSILQMERLKAGPFSDTAYYALMPKEGGGRDALNRLIDLYHNLPPPTYIHIQELKTGLDAAQRAREEAEERLMKTEAEAEARLLKMEAERLELEAERDALKAMLESQHP